jgi:hypothetical protein
MHCNCEQAQTENVTTGARCSCSKSSSLPPIGPVENRTDLGWWRYKTAVTLLTRDSDQRPAGECTCSRSSKENTKPSGSTCACGKRSSGEFPYITDGAGDH